MKKNVLLAMLILYCFACSSPTKNDEKIVPEKKLASVMDNPEYSKGLELAAKSDCFTCHKVNDASTGPSYKDVAAKYPNNPGNVSTLAEKIIKGGKGVWGQVPMTAHPAISQADAEQMVRYILLVKE